TPCRTSSASPTSRTARSAASPARSAWRGSASGRCSPRTRRCSPGAPAAASWAASRTKRQRPAGPPHA
ncbi:MAG: hypothetical protein AVDCRST_MAG11-2603, partial [uncultured Gemmatimonadaceae bacterium]